MALEFGAKGWQTSHCHHPHAPHARTHVHTHKNPTQPPRSLPGLAVGGLLLPQVARCAAPLAGQLPQLRRSHALVPGLEVALPTGKVFLFYCRSIACLVNPIASRRFRNGTSGLEVPSVPASFFFFGLCTLTSNYCLCHSLFTSLPWLSCGRRHRGLGRCRGPSAALQRTAVHPFDLAVCVFSLLLRLHLPLVLLVPALPRSAACAVLCCAASCSCRTALCCAVLRRTCWTTRGSGRRWVLPSTS